MRSGELSVSTRQSNLYSTPASVSDFSIYIFYADAESVYGQKAIVTYSSLHLKELDLQTQVETDREKCSVV